MKIYHFNHFFQLEFVRGKKGDVISRLPSGKIVLVNRNSKRQPKAGEKWLCKIDFQRQSFAVVTPVSKIVKKQRTVMKRFKCGHTEPWITEEVEVPENIEPEPRIRDIIEPELCSQCKRNCKHEDIELTVAGSWVAVNCNCKETLWSADLIDVSDADRALGEIEQRFPELVEVAEEKLNEWKVWKTETTKIIKSLKKLENEQENIKTKLAEIVVNNAKEVIGDRGSLIDLLKEADFELDRPFLVAKFYGAFGGEETAVRLSNHDLALAAELIQRLHEIEQRISELNLELT